MRVSQFLYGHVEKYPSNSHIVVRLLYRIKTYQILTNFLKLIQKWIIIAAAIASTQKKPK